MLRNDYRGRIKSYCGREPSDFGASVAALLDAWVGLHHMGGYALLGKIAWDDKRWIKVPWHGDLSTWDFDRLTHLVLLCHDRCIRCEIRPCNPHHVYLCFSPRVGREGGVSERHPTMEQAIERLRGAT